MTSFSAELSKFFQSLREENNSEQNNNSELPPKNTDNSDDVIFLNAQNCDSYRKNEYVNNEDPEVITIDSSDEDDPNSEIPVRGVSQKLPDFAMIFNIKEEKTLDSERKLSNRSVFVKEKQLSKLTKTLPSVNNNEREVIIVDSSEEDDSCDDVIENCAPLKLQNPFESVKIKQEKVYKENNVMPIQQEEHCLSDLSETFTSEVSSVKTKSTLSDHCAKVESKPDENKQKFSSVISFYNGEMNKIQSISELSAVNSSRFVDDSVMCIENCDTNFSKMLQNPYNNHNSSRNMNENIKRFICRYCSEKCLREDILRHHCVFHCKSTVTSKQVYTSPNRYAGPISLTTHMVVKHNTKMNNVEANLAQEIVKSQMCKSNFISKHAVSNETVESENKRCVSNFDASCSNTDGLLWNIKISVVNCEICKSSFANSECLKLHKQQHHSTCDEAVESKEICKYCEASFDRELILKRQIQLNCKVNESTRSTSECSSHNISESHVCPNCQKYFTRSRYFRRHLRNKFPVRKLQTDNADFAKKESDVQKYALKQGNKTFHPCPLCGKKIASKTYLPIHISMHTGGAGKYRCEKCDKNYYLKNTYYRHIRKCWISERLRARRTQYRCELCSLIFLTTVTYSKHIFMCRRRNRNVMSKMSSSFSTGKNPNKISFLCKLCEREFPIPSLLKRHSDAKHTQFEAICKSCNKHFNDFRVLKEHLRGGQKVGYFCTISENANSAIKNDENMNSASNTENNFTCNACDSKFISMIELVEHLKDHILKSSE